MSSIREALEQRERETLAPQAARSADSRGRLRPEPEDDVRPAFQHDRDRIPARAKLLQHWADRIDSMVGNNVVSIRKPEMEAVNA